MDTKRKQTLQGMDTKKLQSEADKVKHEIDRLQLDQSMGNVKDTNAIAKKKKELAVILTLFNEKVFTAHNTNSEEEK